LYLHLIQKKGRKGLSIGKEKGLSQAGGGPNFSSSYKHNMGATSTGNYPKEKVIDRRLPQRVKEIKNSPKRSPTTGEILSTQHGGVSLS